MSWLKTDGRVVIPGILMMLVMGSVYSYSVFRLPIESYYDVSTSQSGTPYMLSLFFYAVFMGISGKILERIHLFYVMLIGVFCISIGWLIAYFSSLFILLSIGYGLFIGTGIGLIYGIPLMVITQQFPHKKGLYLGLVLLGFGLSPFVTAPFLQSLVENVGLHSTFLVMSVLTLVILTVLAFFYKGYSNTSQHLTLKPFKETLKQSNYLFLYLLFFIATFIGLSVIGFSSTYAVNVLHYSLKEAAVFVSLFAIFNGVGRVIFGFLTDRYHLGNVMLLSFVSIMISTLCIVLFVESVMFFILAFSILWMNLGGWLAIAPAATSQLFGNIAYPRNYGFLFSAYGLSALAGVYITGNLIDYYGQYQSTFMLFLILSTLALFVTLKFKHQLKNII
ncbi:MAG: MFS transporter [Candidatus Izemoplasma sp.]|nr:MFS transporter [Candidatus Izemoplasma sp.]